MESFASFSGFQGAACAQALAQSSSAGPASVPAAASAVPPFTRVRRVNVVMGLPPCCSAAQSFATLRIEQMPQTRIGFEPDLVARLELVALAKHRDDVLAAQFRHHLDFRAGRLDHLDGGLGAVVGDGEMLRPNAADDRAAVRRGCPLEADAQAGAFECGPGGVA